MIIYQKIFLNDLNGAWNSSEKWLRNDFGDVIDKYINKEILDELKIYNTHEVLGYKTRFFKNEPYNWNKLWSIIILNKFLLNE